MDEIRIVLLGGFRVTVGGQTIDHGAWRLRRARSVVKLLALAPNHRLHRDEVLESLWPDHEPEAAERSLHQALHAARQALTTTGLSMGAATALLRLQREILSLEAPGGLWIDLEEFEVAVERARGAQVVAAYEHALALYTGELLPEDRYEDWVAGRRARARELFLEALAGLAALHEAAGRLTAAIEVQQRIVATEPTREEAHRALLRLYARSGQRAQAIRQYQQLREILRRELDADPDPTSQRLYRAILAGQIGPPVPQPNEAILPLSRPRATDNLPVPLTSFVGRMREIAELEQVLATTRLLTLTGTGGCGKTRLTLALAARLVAAYRDGVWLVELAALTDGAFVARAIAGELGIREEPARPLLATLVAAVRSRHLLLVLDNCEHLLDATAEIVRALLSAGPDVQILCTSREPLGLPGELTWRVPALTLPPSEAVTPATLLASDAGRLFVERARLSQPSFRVTPQNVRAVAWICQRLDGLPLAIELATARLNVLSVEQIAACLGESLPLLAGGKRLASPRQQTLRATLDWSYNLLSASEQQLFRRLAAFAGPFELEAVEAVGAGDEGFVGTSRNEVLDRLTGLVTKSLVEVEPAPGAARYRLLETVRQYARERAAASGELESSERRHASHYLAVAEQAFPGLSTDQQIAWLDRLEREHDNLRAALRWSIAHAEEDGGDTAVRFVAALWKFWEIRGYLSEGEHWLETALARSRTVTRAHALALAGAGGLARIRGNYPRAAQWHEASLRAWRTLGDRLGIAMALHNTATVLRDTGQYERAIELLEEALPAYREQGDSGHEARCLLALGRAARDRGDRERAARSFEAGLKVARAHDDRQAVAALLNGLGILAADAGELARAQALHEASLAAHQEVGDRWGIALSLNHLARVRYLQGDDPRALALHRQSLQRFEELGIKRDVALCLGQLAELASTLGDDRQAARLFGAEESLREAIGAPLAPVDWPAHERCVAAVRGRLGEAAFAAAWAEGRTLSLDAAIADALGGRPVQTDQSGN